MPKPTRIMIFGVFDLLHPGHLYVLYHARQQGKELVAVVARNATVKKMKGKIPAWHEKKRMGAVKNTNLATTVILGDTKQGSYAVIRKYHPDLICLGYDQRELKKDLEGKMKKGELPRIPLRTLKPYKPLLFHTSIRSK